MRTTRLALAALVAVPSLVLTLSLVVASTSPSVIAMQAFSPLAVLGYAAALVLLLAPLGGRTGRRVLVAGAGLVAVALVVSTLLVAPRWLRDPQAGTAEAPRLVVMTSNLRLGEADAVPVMDAVRDQQVDLLVLQEVTPALQRQLEELGLREVLPHDAGVAEPGATGTLIYAREPITDVEALATEHRSYAVTVGGLRVFGVHPAYPYSTRWERDQRVLVEAARRERPDLVLGDHNSSLDHPQFRALLDTGLRDAAEQAGSGWQPTWPVGGFRGIPVPLAAIDHVLVGERLVTVATRTRDISGTDHRALIAEIAVAGRDVPLALR